MRPRTIDQTPRETAAEPKLMRETFRTFGEVVRGILQKIEVIE
ncbi:hypothetical protein [Sphingomonas sp.]|nr:hypothetical protein [Sphingomonas sp.]